MITLAGLKTWLEGKLAQSLEEEQGSGGSKCRAYRTALEFVSCQENAQDVVYCVQAWMRQLSESRENEGARRTVEEIVKFIESSYSWDIYTYGLGIKATHRVEGPFSSYEEALERALALWNETENYHTAILIGGMEELRLQRKPCISYYQEYQDAEKTMKVEGGVAFVLEDGRAYYQRPSLQPVRALEVLLTRCREISEEDVEKEYPELVEYVRGLSVDTR